MPQREVGSATRCGHAAEARFSEIVETRICQRETLL